MKENLKLSSSITFRALEAKAYKAAACAAVKAVSENKPVIVAQDVLPHQKRQRVESAIEREVRSIFRALAATAQENSFIAKLESVKGASCKARIRIYNPEDLARQTEEENAYREQLQQGWTRNQLRKPYKANPMVMYALYLGIYDPSKLGSIAIYGEDATLRRALISKAGHIFGYTITSAKLEMGKRLFVVVKLAV